MKVSQQQPQQQEGETKESPSSPAHPHRRRCTWRCYLDPSMSFPFLLLNLVTILWGTQHAVMKSSLMNTPGHPGLINFLRFTIASLLFLPWTPNPMDAMIGRGIWKAGLQLGIWMFLGYGCAAIGLRWTTASRSGFLLYLNVKLVPVFAYILYGRVITLHVWLSALIAFTGTLLLSFDGQPPSIGDLFCVLGAAASAMFILKMEGAATLWSAKYSRQLNSATLWSTALPCGVWCLIECLVQNSTGNAIIAAIRENWRQILYLAVVPTAVCNWIQTVGQRSVPAEKAALIYAMDPVWGAFFAWCLLGETLGPRGWTGGAMIIGAAVCSSVLGFQKLKPQPSSTDEEGKVSDMESAQ